MSPTHHQSQKNSRFPLLRMEGIALTLGFMLLPACTVTLNEEDEPQAPTRDKVIDAQGGAGGMTAETGPHPIYGGCTDAAKDGTCSGTQVIYCEDDQLHRIDCATVGEGCEETKGRADCAPAKRLTACGELDALGDCEGNNITWCDESRIMAVPVKYDCAVYGQQCDAEAGSDGGAVCLSHGECGSIDEDGSCDGNTLSYCDGGELYVFDCGNDQCREVGGLADCFTAGALSDCGSETNSGRCDGNEVVRCLGGTVAREDCERTGMECSSTGTAHCERPASCFADCASGYTCQNGVCAGPGNAEREWTIAMYMVGDNNLSNIVWQDLNEMESVDLGSDIQVVAEMEMSAEYTSLGNKRFRQGAYRFAVQSDSDQSEVTSLDDAEALGEVDMTDPEHLSDYLRWAAETYPSKKFAVIFWDHGFGWRGGFVDSRSKGLLTLQELVTGVRDSGTNPELVGFDACLMGMHEVALALRGVSDTMVASEESVPGGGYPYDKVLERLVDTPAMGAEALGEIIADEYSSHFDAGLRARSVTMSVVDLRQAAAVNEQLATFSQAFLEDLPGRRSEVQAAIRSGNLLRFREKDSADLVSTLGAFGALGGGIGSAANNFSSWFTSSATVVHSQATRNVASASGLAIHLPANAFSLYNSNSLEDYRESTGFLALEPWYEVLANFVETDNSTNAGEVNSFTIDVSWGEEPGGTDSKMDLDLVVIEPSGFEASPAGGSVTSNGLLSADSVDSGVSRETYELRANHQPGTYVILVDLYQASDETEQAFPHASLRINGGKAQSRLRGYSEERSFVEVPMDLSAPLTTTISSDNVQKVLDLEYSSMWYIGTIEVK